MKNFKFTTPIILGILSIAELLIEGDMVLAFILWVFYGLYKAE